MIVETMLPRKITEAEMRNLTIMTIDCSSMWFSREVAKLLDIPWPKPPPKQEQERQLLLAEWVMKGHDGKDQSALAILARMKGMLFANLMYQNHKPEEVSAAYAGKEAWAVVTKQVVDDCRALSGKPKPKPRPKSKAKLKVVKTPAKGAPKQ